MGTALVTGASSGIGETFARHLAYIGYNLIVVARREARLQALADDLPVDVQIVVADLATEDGIASVESAIAECEDLAVLVNNAGFGYPKHFADSDLATQLKMNHLHLDATLRLIYAAIPQMKQHHNGTIINVASIGGLIPMPGSATYNATKAYLVSFSESLAIELAEYGIYVQVLCPGFTRTEIFETAESPVSDSVPNILWLSTDEVVVASLSAVSAKRHRVTPSIVYQIAWRLAQIPPIRRLIKEYTHRAIQ
ncbi:MAG: SDR family oxidoreductase [Chloroflexota bacterium]